MTITGSDRPTHVRIGLSGVDLSIRLRLRWDSAPATCKAVLDLLPVRHQVWHAKYANNEIYTLCKMPDPVPAAESLSVYPSRGDLVYLPLPQGVPLPPGIPGVADGELALDLAYFYESGNSLLSGPHGPIPGTIIATAESLDDIDAMAAACRDVWFKGAVGRQMWIEAG
ncbi:DUF3830 family protein [Nitratireductor sp. CAU 1489]|uniref:DUF3830 family protein n=1 Tax=Nitratireductor arenosus TaxID=2682096 RepID=A0A844QBD0_9HYPH|nr:DUF3830 family protein [Nitratireductor arenosus]MVA96257.1 DUF3830 family protein [Nitratireductor arenosus]